MEWNFLPYFFLQQPLNITNAILDDFLIIVGVAIFIIVACYFLKIPSIVGLFIAGVLAGPYVQDKVTLGVIADIGIVLLLFVTGIQLNIKDVLRIKKVVFIGGSLQIFGTVILVVLFAFVFPWSIPTAILLGFAVSMSSTAVALKVLEQNLEVDSPHGRACLGVSIFQDIMSVPMMLAIPLMAHAQVELGHFLLMFFLKSLMVMVIVIVSALWIIPKILYLVAKIKSRELFLMCILFICLAIAWLTAMVGLSLALGAFLAGLIISESEYGNRALSSILPFQDLFTSFFFMSMGMLLDISFLQHHIFVIIGFTIAALFLKTIATGFSVWILGYPIRTVVLTGIILSQVGEFSFVLCQEAVKPEYSLISNDMYQKFLGISVLSMMMVPFLAKLAPKVIQWVKTLTWLKAGNVEPMSIKENFYHDHLIITGFGLNGKHLAQAAKNAQIPYVVIEMNPQTVHQERVKQTPIFYGDSTSEIVLDHAGIYDARVMVIAISDAEATRRTTEIARRLNPKLHIIARTRYITEIPVLTKLGASEVIPEEFETSIEIFTRVLRKYLIPKDEIESLTREIRASGYEMLRGRSYEYVADLDLTLPNVEITTLRVHPYAPIANKTLADMELRKKYHVTVLAVHRGQRTLLNPGGDMLLQPRDVVFIMGDPESIGVAMKLFQEAVQITGF